MRSPHGTGPIREICVGLLDGLEGRTEVDAASEYAQEIPGEITARMMGVPSEETPQFRVWIHDLLEVGPTDVSVAKATTDVMLDYMQQLIERRRAEGLGDDVVSHLLRQEVDGEPLSDEEACRTLFLFLIAGIDTTWSAIGFCMHHPRQPPRGSPASRRGARADPHCGGGGSCGCTHRCSSHGCPRRTPSSAGARSPKVSGPSWRSRQRIVTPRCSIGLASSSSTVKRTAMPRSGSVVHRCLGSNLARLEMNIALEMWLERFPEFTLTDSASVTYSTGHVRGPRHIPIRIG